MTYLVYIVIGGNHAEHYVTAANETAAIAQVRASLPTRDARWANVFV